MELCEARHYKKRMILLLVLFEKEIYALLTVWSLRIEETTNNGRVHKTSKLVWKDKKNNSHLQWEFISDLPFPAYPPPQP